MTSIVATGGLALEDPDDIYVLIFLLAASMISGTYQVLCASRFRFRIALGTQVAMVGVLTFLLGDRDLMVVLLASASVLSAALFDRHTVGFTVGLVIAALVATLSAVSLRQDPISVIALTSVAGRGLALVGVTLLGVSMMRYRERLIDSQEQSSRLDKVVGQISTANQEYQNNLIEVEASSAEDERKRITRDIHDVVGYTLTNNIMLMEAAIDLTRVDPIRVSRVLQTARDNAEEGLRRIRKTLYDLRTRTESAPSGVSAVVKMTETFEAATHIRVVTSLSNTPLRLPTSLDVVIYHLVQEALVNAFRHGQTTRIDVLLGVHDGLLDVVVRDDGGGAPDVSEGIGLSGMAERVHRLSGHLECCNVAGGFMVHATLPYGGDG